MIHVINMVSLFEHNFDDSNSDFSAFIPISLLLLFSPSFLYISF